MTDDLENLSRSELICRLRAAYRQTPVLVQTEEGGHQTQEELHELLEDLQLYQHKLELQNKELREAQLELQEARNRLADLYDFAPVGYVTLDERGCIQDVNLTAAKLLGRERATLFGKPFVRFVKKEDIRTFLLHLRRSLETEEYVSSELEIQIPETGRTFVELLSIRVPDNRRKEYGYRTAITDITERKKAEQQVHASLREKEVLLKEVHHRVKNNLQTISSLLKLQSGYVKDTQALDLFSEMQDIVRSMALIHEKLYRSSDLASVDYAEYINAVATNLFRSHGVNAEAITLRVDVEHVSWGLDTAIPVSLIINELISNSLKYAFPEGRAGEIAVVLHSHHLINFTLTVCDNGIGIPDYIDVRHNDSLGLQLVQALTDELDGRLTLDRTRGTQYTITFTVQKQQTA